MSDSHDLRHDDCPLHQVRREQSQFLGYLTFGTFHNPEHDPYPPRYERVGESGQWRQTILDEREWLARPDLWGVETFPEPARTYKANLAQHHSLAWFCQQFVRCPYCARLIAMVSHESGFDATALLSNREVAPEVTQRVALRPRPSECSCEGRGFWGVCRHFARGILTDQELFNKLIDLLFGFKDLAVRHVHASGGLAAGQALRREAVEYGRWLSCELIGPNPFRPVAFDPGWRTDAAVSLARQMYDTRDFGIMPILADALQDAGCEQPDILAHCRGDGPHVRGCWVVDLVLGKQ